MRPLIVLGLAASMTAGTVVIAPARSHPGSGSAAGIGVPPAAAGSIRGTAQELPDFPYDGRFAFVRVRFDGAGSGLRSFGRRGRGGPVWAHDYPRADMNFLKILDETTLIGPVLEGSRVLAMDDPEIFKYPAIYVVEVGYWDASEREIEALGEYLAKGGFLIVDDFRGPDVWTIQQILQRAVPGSQLMEVPDSHQIFDAFFRIEEPRSMESYGWEPPTYLGIFENNDPDGHLMAILNYNGDIAEYWEYSDYGYLPIDLTNEAYKFGVNYIVYPMTH